MKKFIIPLMVAAIALAFYEQTKAEKNVFILVIAFAVFMYGMMQLSVKTPSKNQDKEEEDVQ